MSETFVRFIRKHGTSLAVSIPAEIIQLKGIKEGDLVKIVIEKVEKI